MNVKKIKVMVFNYADPCQEFVFEGDVIEHVQTFKYLGILLETTLNLECVVERVVECLAVAYKHFLFALNHHCTELCIMDVVTFLTCWCIP